MRRGELIDETRTTARGLERHRSAEHHTARRRRKVAVVRSVLAEQKTQRRHGFCYPQNLRAASLITSRLSSDLALAVGKLDETVALGDIEARTRNGDMHSHVESREDEHFAFECTRQISMDTRMESCRQKFCPEQYSSSNGYHRHPTLYT